MSELKLGKIGSVKTEQIKAGVKKEDIKDKKLESVFDSVDKDKNGVLDSQEVQEFQDKILEAAGDDELSGGEAAKFLKQNNLTQVDKNDLFKFISTLSQAAENIESSTVSENNGNKFIHIQYKDGSVETINPDKSTEVARQSETGEKIVEYYDANKKLTSKSTTKPDGSVNVKSYGDDGKLVKSETTSKDGASVVTVNYKDGKPSTGSKVRGTTVEDYVFDEQGKAMLTSKIENKGIPAKEKTTEYTYNEDGTVTAVITEAGKTTTQTIKEGNVVSETRADGSTTETSFTENGREEVIKDGDNVTKNVYNSENVRLSQEQTVDGQTYRVEYDGKGNTKGVVVQNGESPAMIAKKFGCSVQDLINANPDLIKGKEPNQYFLVGAEIVIPGELGAADFAKLNSDRVGSKEAIEGYNEFVSRTEVVADESGTEEVEDAEIAEEQRIAEQRAQAEKEQHRAEMKKQGAEIAGELYDDMHRIGTRASFKENIKKINKENVAEVLQAFQQKSPDESLVECIFDEINMSSATKKDAVTHIFNSLTERAESLGIDVGQAKAEFMKLIDKGAKTSNFDALDPVFNTLVAAINGKESLTVGEKEEVKNTSQAEKHNIALNVLDDTVKGAEEALNTQLAEDGWAADLWEGMKWIANSDNLDEKVKADITKYKEQIADLKSSKTPEEFEAKFEKIYGVKYDPEMIKAYQKQQAKQPAADAAHMVETSFNETMKELIGKDKLTGRSQFVQSSAMGGGTYVETASKEDVYKETLSNFASFISPQDTEAGVKAIEAEFKKAGLAENASIDEKYKVLHEYAKTYSAILHENTMVTTDGKGYEVFTSETEHAYKAAFGLKNDIAKRVADYNNSQQAGAMVIKSVAKAAGAVGLAFVPAIGLAGVALGTGVISATIDTTDRLTSEVGLKEGELTEILKNASIDGASVFLGGKLSQMLMKANTFVKIGGQITGDIAVGAGAEKLQTGEITLNGVAFQCVFSAAGNLVSLKQLAKSEVPKQPVSGDPQPVRVSRGVKGDVNNHRDMIADAEVARNADQSHLSANERRMVEQGLEDVPTAEELAQYQKEHGYEPVPEADQPAYQNHQKQVAEDYAEAHRIENNAKITKQKAPTVPKEAIDKLNDEIRGIDGSIKRLEQQIAGAKRFGKNTEKLENQLANLQQKRAAKAAELDGIQKPKVESDEVEVVNPRPDDEVVTVKPDDEVEVPDKPVEVPEKPVTSEVKLKPATEIDGADFSQIEGELVAPGTKIVTDANGNKIRKYFSHDNNTLSEVYDYPPNSSEPSKITVYRDDGKALFAVQDFDPSTGHPIKRSNYGDDGALFSVEDLDAATGHKIKQSHYREDGSLSSSLDYDPTTGYLLKESNYGADGTLSNVYELDPATGHHKKATNYTPDGKMNDVTDYNPLTGKPVKEVFYHADGKTVKFIRDYDPETGDLLKIRTFSENGTPLGEIDHTPTPKKGGFFRRWMNKLEDALDKFANEE